MHRNSLYELLQPTTAAGNGLEDISVTSLAPTSYDQLEDIALQYNIIVDTDYYYRSAAEHEADKDDFVNWMKLIPQLYIKIYLRVHMPTIVYNYRQ